MARWAKRKKISTGAAAALRERLADVQGDARVATLKAVVTQASSAIPVVPLYASLVFRVMKDQGVHESVIEHINRLFRESCMGRSTANTTRQAEFATTTGSSPMRFRRRCARCGRRCRVKTCWSCRTLPGFAMIFLRIFGFGVDGVDYDADVSPLGVAS